MQLIANVGNYSAKRRKIYCVLGAESVLLELSQVNNTLQRKRLGQKFKRKLNIQFWQLSQEVVQLLVSKVHSKNPKVPFGKFLQKKWKLKTHFWTLGKKHLVGILLVHGNSFMIFREQTLESYSFLKFLHWKNVGGACVFHFSFLPLRNPISSKCTLFGRKKFFVWVSKKSFGCSSQNWVLRSRMAIIGDKSFFGKIYEILETLKIDW